MLSRCSILNFSALIKPRAGALMGVFKGYFDESGEDGNALALIGYVSTADGWQAFETDWARALSENGAPYLHMKELQNPKGNLAKFAGKENYAACSKLLGDLVAVIEQIYGACAGALVRLPDLKEFNAEKGLNLEPLPLAMYVTMVELYRLFPYETLELVIDRLDKYGPERTIALAVEYASSYQYDDVSQSMSWLPLKGENSFRNVLPIQAADFAAWEGRKDHEHKNEWWKGFKRGLHTSDWIPSLTLWLEAQGKIWPDQHKSFQVLTKAQKMHANVIDYDILCKLHEFRQGVWSKADRMRLSSR